MKIQILKIKILKIVSKSIFELQKENLKQKDKKKIYKKVRIWKHII